MDEQLHTQTIIQLTDQFVAAYSVIKQAAAVISII